MLLHFAAALSLSSALLIKKLKSYMNSSVARNDLAFLRLLQLFTAANAVSALAYICSSIAIVVTALATKSDDI